MDGHDVDESLIVGDRVLMMGRRPGRIVEEIANPFPRPRSAVAFASREYGPLKSRILERLRAEAS